MVSKPLSCQCHVCFHVRHFKKKRKKKSSSLFTIKKKRKKSALSLSNSHSQLLSVPISQCGKIGNPVAIHGPKNEKFRDLKGQNGRDLDLLKCINKCGPCMETADLSCEKNKNKKEMPIISLDV